MLDQRRGLIELKPGYHVTIRVTPKVIDTSEDFVGFDAHARKCKLPYEADDLKFLQGYTKEGCELECAMNISLAICKCLPWYLPNNFDEVPMCDIFASKCVDTIIADERNYKNCTDQCKEDCTGTSYVAIPSYVPIDPKQTCAQPIFKAIFKKLLKPHWNEIYFEHMTMGKWKNLINGEKLLTDFCQDYTSKYISIVTVETPVNLVVQCTLVIVNS